MESSVGYSQGTGTEIATHQFGTGVDAVHHQRFASGTGRAQLMQVIVPTTSLVTSALLDCLGAGRIVIVPICTVTGPIFTIHFFDDALMDMGISDAIEIETVGTAAFAEVTATWAATTDYDALVLLSNANNHIYQQVHQDTGVYVGGTSAGTEPAWPTSGGTIVDGTVTWEDKGLKTSALNTPLLIFSNSMGAAHYKIDVTTNVGTFSFWSDAV